MTYYPVGIPTLCRYEHFKRCVESLARNTHADKTELVIGLDYPPSDKYREGYEKISKYIDTIEGFAKVTVLRHEKNLGAVKNWGAVQNYIFENYDAAIMTEDDNEFAKCFLDFMNKSLLYYWDNPKVMTVTAYSSIGFEENKAPISFTYSVCAWGIGRWRHKSYDKYHDNSINLKILLDIKKALRIFRFAPSILNMMMDMVNKDEEWGDVLMSFQNIEYDKYQLRPNNALVINWGQDGSGLHSGRNPELIKKAKERGLPKYPTYDVNFNDYKIQQSMFVKIYTFWRFGDIGRYHILPQLYIILKYISFRLINKESTKKYKRYEKKYS